MSLSLWDLKKGQACIIKGFAASLNEHFRERLIDLGFQSGQLIKCIISPSFGAPKLYQVNNTIFSLDNDIASCIEIE